MLAPTFELSAHKRFDLTLWLAVLNAMPLSPFNAKCRAAVVRELLKRGEGSA